MRVYSKYLAVWSVDLSWIDAVDRIRLNRPSVDSEEDQYAIQSNAATAGVNDNCGCFLFSLFL